MINRENNLRIIEKAFIEGTEIPDLSKLDGYLRTLWEKTSIEEQFELWFGNNHFDDRERVLV